MHTKVTALAVLNFRHDGKNIHE